MRPMLAAAEKPVMVNIVAEGGRGEPLDPVFRWMSPPPGLRGLGLDGEGVRLGGPQRLRPPSSLRGGTLPAIHAMAQRRHGCLPAGRRGGVIPCRIGDAGNRKVFWVEDFPFARASGTLHLMAGVHRGSRSNVPEAPRHGGTFVDPHLSGAEPAEPRTHGASLACATVRSLTEERMRALLELGIPLRGCPHSRLAEWARPMSPLSGLKMGPETPRRACLRSSGFRADAPLHTRTDRRTPLGCLVLMGLRVGK